MSRIVELVIFLAFLGVDLIIPLVAFRTRRALLQSNEPLIIRFRLRWWNGQWPLCFVYVTWLIMPLGLATIGIPKFFDGQFPAGASLSVVARFISNYPVLAVFYEVVVALDCSVMLLHVVASLKNVNSLRQRILDHAGQALAILTLILVAAQISMINLNSSNLVP